jgi:signal transduction histidine kinase
VKYLCVFFLLASLMLNAQKKIDTNYLKNLYDNCLEFDESKTDSLLYFGELILKKSAELNYPSGEILGLRLKGMHEEYKNHFEKAIAYYLQTLNLSRRSQSLPYELAAINDLGYVYIMTKQLSKAKNLYLKAVQLAIQKKSVHSLFDAYNNTGGAYNQLHMPDSALLFLRKALEIGKNNPKEIDLSSVYNNLGNVYFTKKEYDSSAIFFQKNLLRHKEQNNISLLWYDHLNISEVLIEKKSFDSAFDHLQRCMAIVKQLGSLSKEADTYALMAKYYERKGEFKNAFDFQKRWYQLDTSLVNSKTNETIADLQENFNAAEREKDNQLLQARMEKTSLRNKYMSMLAFAGFVTTLIVAFYLVQKRMANKKLQEKNDLILKQNEKLTDLNYEKNSLISVVSHDLGTPLVTIKTWNEILLADRALFTSGHQKAIDRIHQSVTKGELLIRNILDVEKAETNRQPLHLENVAVVALLKTATDDFEAMALKKSIQIHCILPEKECYLVSDKQFLYRIVENLLSNALKYSMPHKNIWLLLEQSNQFIKIQVKDEGPGISKEEMPRIFSKYSKLSSLTTNGEVSTGLGLSIVKRLIEELDGRFFCESEIGKGSEFSVVFKQ